MADLKLLKSEPTGVVYADPAKPDYQVRFKTTNVSKGMNGVQVQNYVTEIIVTDSNPITVGSSSANDAISVRVRVSGTVLSATRLDKIITALAVQLPTWENEGVLKGFAPATLPTVPV